MMLPFPDHLDEEMPACWRPTPKYYHPTHRDPSSHPQPLNHESMQQNPMYSYQQPHMYGHHHTFDTPHHGARRAQPESAFQPPLSRAPSLPDHAYVDRAPHHPPGMYHHQSQPPAIYIPEECEDHPPGMYHHHHHHHPPPPQVVYIPDEREDLPPPSPPSRALFEDINEVDVLCGRGAPSAWHPGNKYFRSLVTHYQASYLAARRADKPEIAMTIVKLVKERGGRFLKRTKVHGAGPSGHFCWQDIGEQRAYEKACQALREGAPEIRRRLAAKDRLHLAKDSGCTKIPDEETYAAKDEARDDV